MSWDCVGSRFEVSEFSPDQKIYLKPKWHQFRGASDFTEEDFLNMESKSVHIEIVCVSKQNVIDHAQEVITLWNGEFPIKSICENIGNIKAVYHVCGSQIIVVTYLKPKKYNSFKNNLLKMALATSGYYSVYLPHLIAKVRESQAKAPTKHQFLYEDLPSLQKEKPSIGLHFGASVPEVPFQNGKSYAELEENRGDSLGSSEPRSASHFAEMPAPDRPMAGAFATVHLVEKARVMEKSFVIKTARFAPTRSGAGISAKSFHRSDLPKVNP
jgi:hypothetical protein